MIELWLKLSVNLVLNNGINFQFYLWLLTERIQEILMLLHLLVPFESLEMCKASKNHS